MLCRWRETTRWRKLQPTLTWRHQNWRSWTACLRVWFLKTRWNHLSFAPSSYLCLCLFHFSLLKWIGNFLNLWKEKAFQCHCHCLLVNAVLWFYFNTCDLYLHCALLLRDRNSSVHALLVQESEIWQDRKNDHQSMKLCKHNNNSGHFCSAVSHWEGWVHHALVFKINNFFLHETWKTVY